MPPYATPTLWETTSQQDENPDLPIHASKQHRTTTPSFPPTDKAILMEIMEIMRDLSTEMKSLRSEVSTMSAKLESLEARSDSATPSSWTPPTSPSSAPSALSAPPAQQITQSVISPGIEQRNEEWDPEEIGYFHGDADEVHAFVDRLSFMAPLKGVKLIQANFVTLLKDTALDWYYLELSQDTRTAFNNDTSLDQCCEALIKRFVPSFAELWGQLKACHYTRKDAANKKDAIHYIHKILRIARGLGWSHETSIAMAFNHFEAHLRLNLNPEKCSLSQFIEEVQLRQISWNEIYAGFGRPSPSSESKLHQQPSRSKQFDQTQQQPQQQPQRQQHRPPVGTTQQTYWADEEEDWMYDPPTDSYYPASAHAPAHTPCLYGSQILSPLFTENNERRRTIKNRHDVLGLNNRTFIGTDLEGYNSGWSKYPISINGPYGLLNGSAVAATAMSSWKCNVYFQDAQGGIREYINNEGWKSSKVSLFEAKLFSPLAVISFDSGKEIRLYCVSEDDYLQEWCYSANANSWCPGYLTNSKFRVAANTKLAATYWYDSGSNIRVYAQEPNSDGVQEYCIGNPWKKGHTLPTAHTGSSIAVASWQNNGIHLRVYYQNQDLTLKEMCWDGGWYQGDFNTSKVPRHTSITALGWYSSGVQLRIYWLDAKKHVSGYKWSGGWSAVNSVVGPLRLGAPLSVIEWNTGSNLRFYFQAVDDNVREVCQDSGSDLWTVGSLVATT